MSTTPSPLTLVSLRGVRTNYHQSSYVQTPDTSMLSTEKMDTTFHIFLEVLLSLFVFLPQDHTKYWGLEITQDLNHVGHNRHGGGRGIQYI